MNEKGNSFELLEPRSPESLVPDPWFQPWMIAAAVLVIALAALALLILRKKRPAKFDPMAARQAAHAEAVSGLASIGNIPARDAAVRASLVVRKYLVTTAGDPALFETNEETIARHQAFHAFTDEAKAAAGKGFSDLAALKYAEEPAAAGADEVVAGARSLLETLHQGFRA